MFEYNYEMSMKKFVVWKHEGMHCIAVLVTDYEDRAKRAAELYEKYGAGQLRYPTK